MYSQKKDNGKVQYFESYYDHVKGKYRTVSVTMPNSSRASEKEAYAVLQERIKEKVFSTDLKLKDLLSAHVKFQEETRRPSTANTSRYMAHTLLKLLGNVRTDDLSAGYVVKCIEGTGNSATWKNNVITRFKAILRWAYQRDLVNDISWIDKLPRYKDKSSRSKVTDKYLEPEELKSLLRGLEAPYADFAYLLVLSGLRVGEALALTPSDIDLENRVIHVTKTKRRNYVGEAKTEDSIRDVYMQPELFELCKRLNVPFTFSYFQFSYALNKVMDVTPHVLRHTHASLLFAQGFSLEEVSHRLGHADSKVTKDIYVHLMEQRKQTEKDHLDTFEIPI